jgi:hypothetical protein
MAENIFLSMLSRLASPKKAELDLIILELFQNIPKVSSKITFSANLYGFSWNYEVKKDGLKVISQLNPDPPKFKNSMRVILDDDDVPCDLEWQKMEATHTVSGESTLTLQTLAFLYFYTYLNNFGLLATLISVTILLNVVYLLPRFAFTLFSAILLIGQFRLEQLLIPYSQLNEFAMQIYRELPPLVVKFLRIRPLIIGILLNDGKILVDLEIIYFLGSSQNNKLTIRPINSCLNGTHICIYINIGLKSCQVTEIEFDTVLLKKDNK